MVGLQHYLFVSCALASLGVIAMVSRRNAVSILLGIELILNAAALNFVAFSRFGHPTPESPALSGQVFSIFVIVLAAGLPSWSPDFSCRCDGSGLPW